MRSLLGVLDGRNSLDAAVAILFTSGFRVSEVLGLAWDDLDLDAGTATVRRGSTYTGGGVGQRLDAPKTERTAGIVYLAPAAVELLRVRQAAQAVDCLAAGSAWHTEVYEADAIELVFTTAVGRPGSGRTSARPCAPRVCGPGSTRPVSGPTPAGGRRSPTSTPTAPASMTSPPTSHGSTETTRGYVQHLGDRPVEVARRAWALHEAED